MIHSSLGYRSRKAKSTSTVTKPIYSKTLLIFANKPPFRYKITIIKNRKSYWEGYLLLNIEIKIKFKWAAFRFGFTPIRQGSIPENRCNFYLDWNSNGGDYSTVIANDQNRLVFEHHLILVELDTSWIYPTFNQLQDNLKLVEAPPFQPNCAFCSFVENGSKELVYF
jgi:hypothetical protein